MHDNVTEMGGIIRAAREAKGMTQAALSKATGIAVRTIIDIEKNKRHPTYEVFYKIIRALDLSADHIFWPEKISQTPEQAQLIRAVRSCSDQEQAVFMELAWAYIRAVTREKGATKKADDS
ncbi:MAG: helix-turn-helix domain-containing protein [Oscillospiraceae bacterium]|nr:helix-turn-helix domain-containing protein [Oscillospiraceae bacterium]